MNTDQIELFLDIVKTGSINKSAANFFITHQSAAASIKKLEEEFGYPLFIRSPRGVVLTSDGEIVFDVLKNIYSQYLSLKVNKYMKETVTVMLQFPEIYTLYSQGADFKNNVSSAVKLRTNIHLNSQIINNASNPAENCLYIFYTYTNNPPASLDSSIAYYDCFFEDELFALMNKFHILSNRNIFSQKDIKKYSFAIYQPYTAIVEKERNYFGLNIDLKNIYVTPFSLSSFISLIKSSNIIALLPSLMTKTLSKEQKNNIKMQAFNPTVPIYWWYSFSKNNSEVVQDFMRLYIEAINTD